MPRTSVKTHLTIFAAVAAALLMLTLFGLAETAKADYDYRDRSPRLGSGFGNPDSNSYVPEYRVRTVGNEGDGVHDCYDGILARTHYYTDYQAYYGPHVMWIEYDLCEMRRMGATREDWREVIRHERAHSRGFAHYEPEPRYNAAYDPSVQIG